MSSGLDRESRRFYRKESQTDLTRFWDGGEHYASRNRWCFECAWECANKGRKFRIISILNFISVKQEFCATFVIFFSYFSWGHIHSDKIKNIRFGKWNGGSICVYWTLCGNEGKSRGRRGRFSSTSSIRYVLFSYNIQKLLNIVIEKIKNFELKTWNIEKYL